VFSAVLSALAQQKQIVLTVFPTRPCRTEACVNVQTSGWDLNVIPIYIPGSVTPFVKITSVQALGQAIAINVRAMRIGIQSWYVYVRRIGLGMIA
jgi:hypothetical protein